LSTKMAFYMGNQLRYPVSLVLGAIIGLALLAGSGAASESEVPATNQVPIFLKLLTYDRALATQGDEFLRIGILVRHDNEDSKLGADDFGKALAKMSDKTVNGRSFRHEIVEWETTADLMSSIRSANLDVLYVTEGHKGNIQTIQTITRELDILSLGAESIFVNTGLSIGLGLKDGHPQIWVNLESLHQEGHLLDARILRLCKVVSTP